jgi:site-specific DNA-methyltransferase (adenine-specific)
MNDVKDASVTLVVTSPPYCVGKEYEEGMALDEWKSLMRATLKECDRALIDGGRACINVANTGRNPYEPLIFHVMNIAFDLGWWMRGIVLWIKGTEPDPGDDVIPVSKSSTAWGSFGKATNPILRDNHEFILVFNKGKESIPNGESGISTEEFMSFTNAEWIFQPVTGVDHPAPFPDELPRRCILLYSNKGDTVLDPFGGTATTYRVARYLGRNAITYEKNEGYVPVIKRRLNDPVVIQSKAWELYSRLKELFPDLYSKTSRELRKIASKIGIKHQGNLGKQELMAEIERRRKRQNLDDFVNYPA